MTVVFEAYPSLGAKHWLRGTWEWRVMSSDGRLLADGEGCSCAGSAINTARICAYEEGWLQDVR